MENVPQIRALVRDAETIMESEYPYLEGMEDLADRLGVCRCHLVREFSRQTGISPGKRLTQIRLENARALLASGEYRVEIVARMCGYACGNYFCKAFRAAYGVSPARYAAGAPIASAAEPDGRCFV